jgi:hypothetical protein
MLHEPIGNAFAENAIKNDSMRPVKPDRCCMVNKFSNSVRGNNCKTGSLLHSAAGITRNHKKKSKEPYNLPFTSRAFHQVDMKKSCLSKTCLWSRRDWISHLISGQNQIN